MSDGIYSALSGAIAQERTLAVVANNVANTQTNGYQADKVIFGEFVANSQAAAPLTPLRYVTIDRIGRDAQAGSLEKTGGALDLALQGEGYFAVATPEGERYTRSGSFVTDAEGTLRTHLGVAVLGEAGGPEAAGTPLTIPKNAKEVRIGPDGQVHADGQLVGKLKVVRFDTADALVKEGLTLLKQDGGTALAAEGTTVEQGYLESANVNAVGGMTELITVSRSFEAFQKLIETFRQLDERTARDIAGKG